VPAAAGIEEAMRYSLLAGGKRIRPVLALATARALGADPDRYLPAACAIELIHTYSLIHDDLPAMDDDELRRGLPTSHVKFGEDVAILAGDGLFAEAIRLFCEQPGDPARVLAALRELSAATGVNGMVGGQYVDVTGEIEVFEAVAARDGEARAAGVLLLSGAGFDVVPSDCLAAHVARRLPDATRLRISIGGDLGVSRGTAKTMLEGASRGTRVRRAGAIVELARAPRATADFGDGPRPTIGVGWGDVATAWRSTGIPDIEVYFEATPRLARAASMPRSARSRTPPGAAFWSSSGVQTRRSRTLP